MTNFDGARESARRDNGQFGVQPLDASNDVVLGELSAEAAFEHLADITYVPGTDDKADPELLRQVCSPENVVANAHRFYEHLGANGLDADSATREAGFQYAAVSTGRPYNDFYDAWLNEENMATDPCIGMGDGDDAEDQFAYGKRINIGGVECLLAEEPDNYVLTSRGGASYYVNDSSPGGSRRPGRRGYRLVHEKFDDTGVRIYTAEQAFDGNRDEIGTALENFHSNPPAVLAVDYHRVDTRDPNGWGRFGTANEHHPHDLALAATRPDSRYRIQAAGHRNTPSSVLIGLSGDLNYEIRAIAARKLTERGYVPTGWSAQ